MAGVANSSKPQQAAARSNLPEMLQIFGTITTNGAAPTIFEGKGFVVTQQGTGLYRIKPNINTVRIVSVQGLLVKAGVGATFLEVQDKLASNNYVTFKIVNASGTIVAPGAVGDQITFTINVMTVRLPA